MEVGVPTTFPETSPFKFFLTAMSRVIHIAIREAPLTRTLCGQVRQLPWGSLPRTRPDQATPCNSCTAAYNKQAQAAPR